MMAPTAAVGLALLLPQSTSTSNIAPRTLLIRPSVLACSANYSSEHGTHIFTGRNLLPDQQTFFGHFRPSSLAITFTKVIVDVLSTRLSEVSKIASDMEEEDEHCLDDEDVMDVILPTRSHYHLNLWTGFTHKFGMGAMRELSCTSVLRTYEMLLLEFVTPKMGRMLTKNMAISCMRKADRFEGHPFIIFEKVFLSTLKCKMLMWAGVFTVDAILESYFIFFASAPTPVPKLGDAAVVVPLLSAAAKRDRAIRRIRMSALRCTLAWILGAAGAAAGTLAYPGTGSFVGSLVGAGVPFVALV